VHHNLLHSYLNDLCNKIKKTVEHICYPKASVLNMFKLLTCNVCISAFTLIIQINEYRRLCT